MVVANLINKTFKARVYKEGGTWKVFRTYNSEVWVYTNWKSAFRNAYLNVALMRKGTGNN